MEAIIRKCLVVQSLLLCGLREIGLWHWVNSRTQQKLIQSEVLSEEWISFGTKQGHREYQRWNEFIERNPAATERAATG